MRNYTILNILRAKRDIQKSTNLVSLSDAENFIAREFPAILLATDSGKIRLASTMTEADKTDLLTFHISNLASKALSTTSEKVARENVNALAYLMSANGYPIAAPFNQKAVDIAAQHWLCFGTVIIQR